MGRIAEQANVKLEDWEKIVEAITQRYSAAPRQARSATPLSFISCTNKKK